MKLKNFSNEIGKQSKTKEFTVEDEMRAMRKVFTILIFI